MAYQLTPLLQSFTVTASVLGLVAGLWQLLWPQGFARLETIAGSPFSLRRGLRPFDIARNIDRYFYRHHKSVGLFVLIASMYTLYQLMFAYAPEGLRLFTGTLLPSVVEQWLANALRLSLMSGNLFTLVIGYVIYVRPSALKEFEAKANRWLTLRKKTLWLRDKTSGPREALHSHPRYLGGAVVLLSIWLTSIISIG